MTNDLPMPVGTVGAEIAQRHWPDFNPDPYVISANRAVKAATAAADGVQVVTTGGLRFVEEGQGQAVEASSEDMGQRATALNKKVAEFTAQAQGMALNAANHRNTQELLTAVAADHDRTKDALTAMGISMGIPQPQMQKYYDELKTAAETAASKIGGANKATHQTLTQATNSGTALSSAPEGMPGGSGSGLSGLDSSLQQLTQLATTGPQLITGSAGQLISQVSGLAGPLVEQLAAFDQSGGDQANADGKGGDGATGGESGRPGSASGGTGAQGGDTAAGADKVSDGRGLADGKGTSHDRTQEASLDTSRGADADSKDRPGGAGAGGAGGLPGQQGNNRDGGPTYTDGKPGDGKPEAPADGQGEGDKPRTDPSAPATTPAAAGDPNVSTGSTHLSSGEAEPQRAAHLSNVTGVADDSRTGGDAPATSDRSGSGQTHTSAGASAVGATSLAGGAPAMAGAPAAAPVMGGMVGGLGAGPVLGGGPRVQGPLDPAVADVRGASTGLGPDRRPGPSVPEQYTPDTQAEEALEGFAPAMVFGAKALSSIVRQNPLIGSAAIAVYPSGTTMTGITCTPDGLGTNIGDMRSPNGTTPLASIQNVPEQFRTDWLGADDPALVLAIAIESGLIETPAAVIAVSLAAQPPTGRDHLLVQRVTPEMLSRVEPLPTSATPTEQRVRAEHILPILAQQEAAWSVPQGITAAQALVEMRMRRWAAARHPEAVGIFAWWAVLEAKLAHEIGDLDHAAALAWQLLALPEPPTAS